MSGQTLGFIGGGNMAMAIVGRLLSARPGQYDILASEPDPKKHADLTKHGVGVSESNAEVAKHASILVLAVKPQVVPAVLVDIKDALGAEHVIISIAASVSTHAIETIIGGRPRVIRAMPNTPALVGEGATALSKGAFALDSDLKEAAQIFECVGRVVSVPESDINAVTALSGCGPGYMFAILEALIEGAVSVGLEPHLAKELAAQTMLGAAKLLQSTDEHPSTLRNRVATPGGVTAAGLSVLDQRGVHRAIVDAVRQAKERADELSTAADSIKETT